MLKIFDITKSFGNTPVLNRATFELGASSIAGLIGPSGGGKSTLLKILGGVVSIEGGDGVFYDNSGHKVTPNPEHEKLTNHNKRYLDLGCTSSLMFQEGALFDSMTVLENVVFPLLRGRSNLAAAPRRVSEDAIDRARVILSRVGLSKSASKFPAQLSGGMRRRLSLARALINRPQLVLLDDPTSGLDPVASSVIMDLISELHREYLPTTVMVSHDLRRLLPVVDTLIGLFHGRIVYCAPPKDLLDCSNAELLHFISCRFNLESLRSESQYARS